MTKITARIEKSPIDNALWLFIDRVDGRTTVAEDLPFERNEDEGNVAYPILESELVAIREAIDSYLSSKQTDEKCIYCLKNKAIITIGYEHICDVCYKKKADSYLKQKEV